MSEAPTRSVRPPGPTAPPVTIGRERERARLVEAVLSPPALIAVEGEAGVGKTRLLRDLAADPALAGRRVLSARCLSVGDPFPLGAVVDALRGLAERPPPRVRNPVAGALAPLLPELAGVLPDPPQPLADPLARLHVVARAVRAVLSELGPSVLVLDDFHHAHRLTLSVVGSLVAELPPDLAVVLAYRREDVPEGSPLPRLLATVPPSVRREVLVVRPLDPAGVRDMVAACLGRDHLPEAFVRAVSAATSGLPFVVEETIRSLAERGRLEGEEALHEPPRHFSEVPPTLRDSVLEEVPALVRDFVLARLERLSPASRDLLRAAALPEPPVEERLLRAVSGLRGRRFDRAVAEALEAGLLEDAEERTLRLRHPFARVAIHRGLAGPDHRRLHLRTARALRTLGLRDEGSLAHHYREAEEWSAWARHGERAADRASSVGDDGWAARILQELLGTPGLPRETRVRLARKLGHAALHGLAHHEALRMLQDLVEDPSLGTGVRGELRLWLARLLLQAGAVSEYRREAETAARELRRRPELAATAHVVLGIPVLAPGHVEDHRRALHQIEELLPRVKEPIARRRVMAGRAILRLLLAEPDGWRSYREVPKGGSSIEERRNRLRLDVGAGLASVYVGRLDRAGAMVEKVIGFVDDRVFAAQACWIEALDVWYRFTVGRWAGLEERARRSADRHRAVPLAACHLRLVEGLLVMACRSHAEGERLLAETYAEAQRLASVPLIAVCAGSLGWSRMELGRNDAAAAVTLEALEVLRRKGAWAWGSSLVPSAVAALAADGRLDHARALIAEMERGVSDLDVPGALPKLALARGIVAHTEEDASAASTWFLRAERGFQALGQAYGTALARVFRAAAVSDADPGGAASLLRESLVHLGGLGAAADIDRVSRRLRALGVPVPRPWRGGRRGYGDHLSPREREVARLVSEGKTNREIARALFLSPRTVGHHVSNAMRKVGVSSRAALAVAVLSKPGEGDSPGGTEDED